MQKNRRTFLAAMGATVAAGATRARAQDACLPFDSLRQKATTPEEALQILKDGNARFVSGKSVRCDLMAMVKATSEGQAPIAAVVGCIDSRVPPEMVFDQHIGDIFSARIAGNFVNPDIIGSLEFATKVAGAKAIVVLGHTGCGAIKGAIDKVELGNLTALLRKIEPAVSAAGVSGSQRTSSDHASVLAVTEANARLAAKSLTENSDILRDLVATKSLLIAAAIHSIETGVVRFL